MIRFPELPAHADQTFLIFNRCFYAKHNRMQVTSAEKYVGFLTEHTIFFVLEGTKYFYLDNKQVEVSRDKPLLLKRGIYTMSEQLAGTDAFEALMIFIPDSFLKALTTKYKLTGGDKVATDYVSLIQSPLLENFRDQYLQYFARHESYLQNILDLKLEELFLILFSSKNKTAAENFTRAATGTSHFDFDYLMNEHMLRSINIADLAKLSGRSLSSFKRDFKSKYHTSPRNWINTERLKQAHRYLSNTDKTVSEICYACGFESTSHFIKLFKKQFGITPTQLRAK